MLSLLLTTLLTLPATAAWSAQGPIPTPSKPDKGKIAWTEKGYEAALAEAKASGKPVFLDFYADWCQPCRRMAREVFSQDEVAQAAKAFLCVSLDYDKQREIAERWGIKQIPAMLFLNPDGTLRDRIDAFQEAPVFLANLVRIQNDIGTLNEFERKLAATPADLSLRFEFYKRLKAAGQTARADAQRTEIKKLDTANQSHAARTFQYEDIKKEIEGHWAQTRTLNPQQIDKLRKFMEDETDPELIYDGWMSLANTYKFWNEEATKRGAAGEAASHRTQWRICLAKAWRGVPQDDETLNWWGYQYCGQLWDQKDELSADDKAFYLRLSDMMVRRFEREPLAHDYHGRALYLSGRVQEAMDRARAAIDLARKLGQDPKEMEKRLELYRGG
jgi:thiol-disulfide isomerase/thioredoxin